MWVGNGWCFGRRYGWSSSALTARTSAGRRAQFRHRRGTKLAPPRCGVGQLSPPRETPVQPQPGGEVEPPGRDVGEVAGIVPETLTLQRRPATVFQPLVRLTRGHRRPVAERRPNDGEQPVESPLGPQELGGDTAPPEPVRLERAVRLRVGLCVRPYPTGATYPTVEYLRARLSNAPVYSKRLAAARSRVA